MRNVTLRPTDWYWYVEGEENVKTGEKGEGYDDSLFAPMAEAFRSDLSQWIENATVILQF